MIVFSNGICNSVLLRTYLAKIIIMFDISMPCLRETHLGWKTHPNKRYFSYLRKREKHFHVVWKTCVFTESTCLCPSAVENAGVSFRWRKAGFLHVNLYAFYKITRATPNWTNLYSEILYASSEVNIKWNLECCEVSIIIFSSLGNVRNFLCLFRCFNAEQFSRFGIHFIDKVL